MALGREAGAGCFLSLTTKLHRVRFSRGKDATLDTEPTRGQEEVQKGLRLRVIVRRPSGRFNAALMTWMPGGSWTPSNLSSGCGRSSSRSR